MRHRTVKRKKAHGKKMKKKGASKQSAKINRAAYWTAYRDLQKKVDHAWTKLRSDVARKAKPQILIKDKNHLLLLLGECNYMARECMRLSKKTRHR